MKTIFDSIEWNGLKLKNRMVCSATWEALADEEGHMEEAIYGIYEELAKGGVGLIISGFTSVSDHDHYFEGIARLSNDSLIPEHQRLTAAVLAQNCPILAQLAMGEYSIPGYRNMEIDDLSAEDVQAIIDLFVDGARRAKQAGYDGVQIHGAHGFFLSRFISPLYNHRKDAYGGSPEGRGKILIDILRRIKAEQPGYHASLKINSTDLVHSGLTPEESMVICKACADAGYDSIEASGNGTSVPGIRPGVNKAYFKSFALDLAEEVDTPIILVGGHRSVESMNAVLNEGKIAALSLSRPLIREPDLPNRWQSGDTAPAKCVSCNRCYSTPGHLCVFNMRKDESRFR